MARRSILTSVLAERSAPEPEPATAPATGSVGAISPSTKPSRQRKIHLGGYYDPNDPMVIAFQKLKIDLRRSQEAMLLDAIADYVAKHQAERAFQS